MIAAQQKVRIAPEDLAWVRSFKPEERIGAVIRLNASPAYGNRIDALALLAAMEEQDGDCGEVLADSSPNHPAPSGLSHHGPDAGVPLQGVNRPAT